jgi:hypothetical protein
MANQTSSAYLPAVLLTVFKVYARLFGLGKVKVTKEPDVQAL